MCNYSSLYNRLVLIISLVITLNSGARAESGIRRYTVFNASENNVNTYRIPSLITTKDGVLIAACEARRNTWRDKSPTDIAIKRSTDGGVTWSNIQFVTDGAKDKYAFMDPCLLADKETGKVFLFACRWPETPHDGTANVPFMLTSDDNGLTWSAPVSVANSFTLSAGYVDGFGPGSGIQMQGDKYKGRLVVPIRIMDATTRRNRAVYSDDHGATWTIGGRAPRVGEFQIAELPNNVLYYNSRINGGRAACYSTNGGTTWGNDIIDQNLPGIERGCQGSVLGIGDVLLYCGIQGGEATTLYDDRCKLTLYKSIDSGENWQQNFLLYEKAAGYSCITQLSNGDIAILFEAGDDNGFIKSSVRNSGWMRLDLIIISQEFIGIEIGTSILKTKPESADLFFLTEDKNKIVFKNNVIQDYQLFSITGKVIKKGIIGAARIIDISEVVNGIYILVSENQKQIFIK